MPVDLNTFDPVRAMTLREAANSGKLNVRGRRPSVQMVQRWANPKRGHRPVGKDGPTLVLATVRTSRELLTMPEWVDDFASSVTQARIAYTRRLTMTPTQADNEKRAREAMQRMGMLPREK